MRALLQRVSKAGVAIDGKMHAETGRGLLIFLGIAQQDIDADARYLAQRCSQLRIFGDDAGKMNLSVRDTGGETLVVSQFTLYADTRRGNRPGFTLAAPPDAAERLYEVFLAALREDLGDGKVKSGVFRAMMEISLVNDGPVTIMLESVPHTGTQT